MKINFYCNTLEELQELEVVIKNIAKQHFSPYDYAFTTFMDWMGIKGYIQIHLKSEAYFNDLCKAKDKKLNQNNNILSGDFCEDVLENLSFVTRPFIE